jgi:hypothetical protein
MQMAGFISTSGNSIKILGPYRAEQTRWLSAALFRLIEKQKYPDIVIDFSECTSAYESGMLPIIAVIANYLRIGIEFELVLPNDHQMQSLFRNCNWSHFFDPAHVTAVAYSPERHVPALQFKSSDEQFKAVDQVIAAILKSLPTLSRPQITALEWSINEITDNVLNHSESPVGGFIQATTYINRNVVEFVVADAGIGIPRSLGISDPKIALERAIQEGVTRNKKTNAGNGLYGAFRVSALSMGSMNIDSYGGQLYVSSEGRVRAKKETIPYPGTVITCKIDCSDPNLLINALTFQNKKHEVVFDFIDRRFEGGESSDEPMKLRLVDEVKSFGSRESGKAAYNLVRNLLSAGQPSKLRIDFEGVHLISSSFADEMVGRLFAEMGPLAFMQHVEIANADTVVKSLIDRAIMQRSAVTVQS